MITNPDAVTVLCYGDSNTYGQRAAEIELGRWPVDVRWTGQLQNRLGDGYHVIEEGLGGRTTDVDEADRPGCNGRTYLLPCLHSQHPLDVVVLMLGTNDLKVQFNRTPAQVVAAAGLLLDDIEAYAADEGARPPTIILLAPVPVDDREPMFAETYGDVFDATSVAKSRELPSGLRVLADTRGVLFADAGAVARAGDDGVHLSLDSHRGLAALVADKITLTPGR